MSPIPERERLAEYALKGVHLGLRQVGMAPEQRTARRLAEQARSRRIVTTGPRVVVLEPRDWAVHVQWEGMIAQALRLRGADVRFVTCGGGLELCDRVNAYEGPPVPCTTCTRYVEKSIDAHGFPRLSIREGWEGNDPGDWLELDELSFGELIDVAWHDLPLGELVDIPLRWFLMRSRLNDEPLAPLNARRFLRSARRVLVGLERAFEELQPDVLLLLNGLFFFEAIATAMAIQRGVPVLGYERGFIPGTLIVHHGDPNCLLDVSDTWDHWRGVPLTPDQETELDRYLDDRRMGRRTMDMYWKRGTRYELDGGEDASSGRLVTLFTNLTWDSAVLGQEVAFPSIHDWVATAIEWAAAHPEHRLVVRIHPAEVKLPGKQTREPLASFIRARFPGLPSNVTVLEPSDPTSSYVLMEAADVGLVFTSTVGLELALHDVPVIVAGNTHYRDKGFTVDVSSSDQFMNALDAAVADPTTSRPDHDLARRYAYLFFFRAPIGAPYVEEHVPGLARITIDDLSELEPGHDTEVDRICDEILGAASSPP